MEPRMESVIEKLIQGEYKNFLDEPGANITELLYFLSEDQVLSLCNKLKEVPAEKYEKAFQSLVDLYPMTRFVVLELLKCSMSKPSDFLRRYDADSEMQKTLIEFRNVLDNATGNSIEVSREVDEYREKIAQIEKSLEEQKEKRKEHREQFKKKESLERELEEITSGIDNIDTELKSLEKEIEKKKEERKSKGDEKKKLRKELNKLKDAMDGNAETNEKYLKALNGFRDIVNSIE